MPDEIKVILDQKGKVVKVQGGTAIETKDNGLAMFKSLYRNITNQRTIVTHNHTFDSFLSLRDVQTGIMTKQLEVRGTTPSGPVHVVDIPEKFSGKQRDEAFNFFLQEFGSRHKNPPKFKDFLRHPFKSLKIAVDIGMGGPIAHIEVNPVKQAVIEKRLPGIKSELNKHRKKRR